MPEIVLSRYTAAALLYAREEGIAAPEVSLDLNMTTTPVVLGAAGVQLTEEAHLTWEQVREISDHATGCFVLTDGELERLYTFSERTARAVSLCSHLEGAPTMLVAGFPMHRIRGIDPWTDIAGRLATVAPVTGRVLDICTGLGYSAIQASQTASSVTTIELDPAVERIARRNPWSARLFDNPKITRLSGDAIALVETLPAGGFDLILHDPPTMQLSGELYSASFYASLRRLLSRRGRLFHYIGDPNSRTGASTTKGVHRRLKENGFAKVIDTPDAFGIVASV